MAFIPVRLVVLGLATTLLNFSLFGAEIFRVATYNVENYLDRPSGSRPAKSDAARAKVRESIRALKPDVIALQEIGATNTLLELQSSLKTEGLDLPYWECVAGFDTNIHVAVLSKFPFSARLPHTNDSFLLDGRRFHVSRGFVEVEVRVNARYSFNLITAHLKSRRTIAEADEADLRLEEAKLLRKIIEADLAANPSLNLVVLGDFNDLHDSQPIKTLLGGRGKKGLLDTRPAERNGDSEPGSDHRLGPRKITWTHFYAAQDTYSRIDYILLSQGMAREWLQEETWVLAIPNWGVASDHRPIVAGFVAEDR